MRNRFKKLLHHYKVEAFKASHSQAEVDARTKAVLAEAEEILNNAYTYHFQSDPSPEQIETFQLIKNFTVESVMPPVVEKLTRRIQILEAQHEELVTLVGNILETLSSAKLEFED